VVAGEGLARSLVRVGGGLEHEFRMAGGGMDHDGAGHAEAGDAEADGL
jgi:hypothetical protein